MCGIAGMLSFGARSHRIDPTLLTGMRDVLTHRGPDGAGLWMAPDGSVGLAHRRLAIVDLSAEANQPMASDDGTLVLTFNGEIYNHASIRRTLDTEAPAPWQTDHSDTEVLLRAWQHWGVDALSRLNGMFAFAIWDTRARALWLVRDRLGIKPLYYRRTADGISFASEIKALLYDPAAPRTVNEEAFFYYLSLCSTPPEETLFAGIRKIAVASWLRIDANGNERTGRYWDPWDHVVPTVDETDDTRAERVLTMLDASVRLRSVADVPVGTLLSGGVDSSTITALLARQQRAPVRTFSVGFRDIAGDDDERGYARMLAARVGARHAECILDIDGLFETVDRAIYLADEPSGHGVATSNLGVAGLARQHGVIVVLGGEGGDELFYGYEEWQRTMRAQTLANRLGNARLARAAHAGLTVLGRGHGMRAERLRRLTRGEQLFWGGAEGWSHAAKLALLAPRLRARFRQRSPWEILAPLYRTFRAKAWDPSPFHWATYLTLHTRLPEMLLRRVDRSTMGVSVEGRVPFLDHHFVELVLGIPVAAKLRAQTLKFLLKHAIRELVPREIITRPKHGMPIVPLQFLHDSRVASVAGEEILRFARQSELLDCATAQSAIDARGRRFWILFEVARWWHRFIASPGSTST